MFQNRLNTRILAGVPQDHHILLTGRRRQSTNVGWNEWIVMLISPRGVSHFWWIIRKELLMEVNQAFVTCKWKTFWWNDIISFWWYRFFLMILFLFVTHAQRHVCLASHTNNKNPPFLLTLRTDIMFAFKPPPVLALRRLLHGSESHLHLSKTLSVLRHLLWANEMPLVLGEVAGMNASLTRWYGYM